MTKFNLQKDLIFFDLEATGLSVVKDKIVQIAMIKYTKDGREEEFETLVNPGVPISPEAYAVHGISSKDVANKPTFQQLGSKILDFIGDADLAGYNSDRFDIPMLMEEFSRVGLRLDMSVRRTIDVQRIFYKMEPRTLSAAYKYYCGAVLENAHDAMVDVKATAAILEGQIKMYDGQDYVDKDGKVIPTPVRNDIKALSEFTNDLKFLDATQKIKVNEKGEAVFSFGKHINRPVGEALYNDRQYYNWMLEKDFSTQLKEIIKSLVKEYEKSRLDANAAGK